MCDTAWFRSSHGFANLRESDRVSHIWAHGLLWLRAAMYDRFEDMPTLPFVRLEDDAPTVEEIAPRRATTLPSALQTDADTLEALSTTLPIAAADAYDLFCDVEAIPGWLSVVRSVRVIDRHRDGRVKSAAFLGQLEGASIGYTLHYRHWDDRRMVAWTTAPGTSTEVTGRARFAPLGDRACLMQYELALAMPSLPAWGDPSFDGHPISAVIADFREHIDRQRRR